MGRNWKSIEIQEDLFGSLRIPRLDPPMEGCLCTCFSQGCFWVLKIGTGLRSDYLGWDNKNGGETKKMRRAGEN